MESAPAIRVPIPKVITDLAALIAAHRGLAILVGGCVRDGLLGITPHDWDIEVFNIPQQGLETILESAGGYSHVGKSFGIYKLLKPRENIDISLPREDYTIGPSHRHFHVTINPFLSYKDATSRRDLTVNSMGYDPLAQTLLDPYGGAADLENYVLRATMPQRFSEDPLRGLRVAQMAARFCMAIDPELVEICKTLPLETLSSERIAQEFSKLLLMGKKPSLGLQFLKDATLLHYFPELHHLSNNDWLHTLRAMDQATKWRNADAPDSRTLMYGALCVALQNKRDVTALLKRITTQKRLIQQVSFCYDTRDTLIEGPMAERTKATFGKLAQNLSKRGLSLAALWRLSWVLHGTRAFQAPVEKEKILKNLCMSRRLMRAMGVWLRPKPPCVTGGFLLQHGISPGASMKHILDICYEIQLEKGLETPAKILSLALDPSKKRV